MSPKEQLEADAAYVRAALEDLNTQAETRSFDDDEQRAFDEGVAFITKTRARIAQHDQIEALGPNVEVERSNDAPSFQIKRTTSDDDIYDLTRSRHFTDPDEYANDVKDRAVRSLESWDKSFTAEHRESAEAYVRSMDKEQYPGQAAAHVLRTGNPAYLSAFKKIMRNPTSGMIGLNSDEARAVDDVMRAALNEGTTTQGGFLVPPMLDPNIILTNNGISNPFRQISTVKTIGTQTWKGITSAGVTAEWTAEAAEVADATPTVAQPSITPVRADAYVQASIEMLQDTNISADVSMLIADAKDRLEGTAFAVGTGSTQPFGVVTELGLVTASRTSATTNGSYGAVDIFALDNNLPQRWRQNASWVANKTIWNLTRQFAVGGSNSTPGAFWTDFGAGRPSNLIGYPVYEASAMQSSLSAATASSDDVVVLGDFKAGYYIIDRMGLELVYNPLVLGSNRRPTGEVGWVAFWRVGARAVVPQAFQMLRV